MQQWTATIISTVSSVYGTMGFADVLDILVVAFFTYEVIVIVRETRTSQLIKVIVIFVIAYVLAERLSLKTFGYLLTTLLQFGMIALFVVFQPEIRRALEQVGRTNFFGSGFFKAQNTDKQKITEWRGIITGVCDAVERLSDDRIGALVVFERHSNLYDYKRTGTVIGAVVTPELIGSLFFDGTPLHDGAIIISDARLSHAGCVLPLSANVEISKDLGTRHRAALGTAEISDAIVVVVSEETGIVSLAKNGILIRRIDRQALYRILEDELLPKKTELQKKSVKSEQTG